MARPRQHLRFIRGRKPAGARGSDTYAAGRVCARGSCPTKLSRYNKGDFCYSHKPYKRPRLRGRVLDDADARAKPARCRSCAGRQRWWKGFIGDMPELLAEGVIHRVRNGHPLCDERQPRPVDRSDDEDGAERAQSEGLK